MQRLDLATPYPGRGPELTLIVNALGLLELSG